VTFPDESKRIPLLVESFCAEVVTQVDVWAKRNEANKPVGHTVLVPTNQIKQFANNASVTNWMLEPSKATPEDNGNSAEYFGFVREFCDALANNRVPDGTTRKKLMGDLFRYCLFGPLTSHVTCDETSHVKEMVRLTLNLAGTHFESLLDTVFTAILMRCTLATASVARIMSRLKANKKNRDDGEGLDESESSDVDESEDLND
jgi:hypothetical protein